MHDKNRCNWDELPAQQQLELREAYGRYLDSLPPTCDLTLKIERFSRWLAERGIEYRHPP